MADVFLVETTLRDGSYAVDFQFTGADTAFLVSTLDQAGITYIELCHGSGFRNEVSPYRSKTRPADIDEAHLEAAQSAVRKAKLGVITGPWAVQAFPLLVKHGFSFVRFGLLPHELLLDESFATVDAAKQVGLTVSINLMQTSSVPVEEVARASKLFAKRGADWFYVVDSAGGMMPQKVRDYVRAVLEESGLVVGLHAHNNTGLALANCLAAIEAGATRVDSTLQGVGRGTGNPSTEQLLLALQALGHERDVQLDPILRLGDLARPLFDSKGQEPTFFASGIAEIHSSNVPLLLKCAEDKQRSPREFLVQVGRGPKRLLGVGIKTLPEDITRPALELTPPVWKPSLSDAVVESFADQMLRSSARPADIADALFSAAAKVHKRSVLHLVPEAESWFAGAAGWETDQYVGVTVPIDARWAVDVGDRRIDVVVVDPACGPLELPGSQIVRYAYRRLVVDAAADLAEMCAAPSGAVALAVAAPSKTSLQARLSDAGVAVDGNASVVIADGSSREGLSSLAKTSTVILIGKLGAEWVAAGRAVGARVVRPLLGSALAAKLASTEATAARLRRSTKPESVDSVRIVDVFVAAGADDVIVDDELLPTHLVSAGTTAPKQAARAAARLRLQSLFTGKGSI